MSSKAASERNQRVLLDLARQPGNDRCADCRTPNPRWASWNLGIFLCVQCAGVHRKMGTHISKVKSLTLDTWTREQVECMKASGGNTASNAKYNPDEMRNRPPNNIDQSERGSELEKYIRKKYELKKFMDRGPPPVPQKDPPSLSRQSSFLASPRVPDGRHSPSMLSPSLSASSSNRLGFSSPSPSSSSVPRSPALTAAAATSNSSASDKNQPFLVPARSSSSAATGSSSQTAATNGAQSQPTRAATDTLLIPGLDSVPTQPSPSPTIALFPPSQQQQQQPAFQYSAAGPSMSSPSFMDAFSVGAAGMSSPGSYMSGNGMAGQMGMAIGPASSPSLSPFGNSQVQQQQQQHTGAHMGMLQPAFGLGVGTNPTGMSFSQRTSPAIPAYGTPSNPFQQQQQQQQMTGMSMGMNGMMMNGGGGMQMGYGSFNASNSSLPNMNGGGMMGAGGLSIPYGSSSSASSSPAPFANGHFGSPLQQPQQPMFQQQQAQSYFGGSPGGMSVSPQVQPQPTGFDVFANGMLPAHLRRQQ
ncbi:Protein gts1 [Tilletia horrida]|uniref:Protein gts1 n=1 Tax=Tilletia horrida TaxID=155126 RepID=A0AAN6GQN5_9BASI|nr:Protein gts1 [Tilletia horrida]KAK0568438.1 Protein gts1 [Tilletia horrida]